MSRAVTAETPGGREREGRDEREEHRGRGGRRATLGYALLFSVPVGVGVASAVTRVAGAPLSAPIAAGPGLAVALALFASVLLLLSTGEADPRRGGP